MVLSVYQINNVLRVYKDQLRQNRGSGRPADQSGRVADRISISAGAKRKAIVDKVASDIASRITQYDPRENLEKEGLQTLENGYSEFLDTESKDSGKLIFKMIDKEEESINSLSVEDSNFMAHKLQAITPEAIDRIEPTNLEN